MVELTRRTLYHHGTVVASCAEKDRRLEISPNISFLHICGCMEPSAHAEAKMLIKVPPACRPAAREEGAPQGPTGVQAGSA